MTKNPDLKNLRVAVVPVGGTNIDQKSTVEEILACSETKLYPITDYFQAQNDEELDFSHWSFLIDMTNKRDWTGSNIDGIHQNDKEAHISYIKAVIKEWGETSCAELELDHSPCLNSVGNGKNNVSELIEQFNTDGVESVIYQDELTLGYENYAYEDLSDEILDEIYTIIQNYEADMLKTEKRCED